ncbi:hypothetical protein DFQ27_007267 [Actinomortierella ambigua]|uniref:Tyr recombinase domain-containing protein n=1 Tax=Actinomortierella ambigua TaxID=1343610 RepID=A0A9P6PWV8_9FUNG|nr:hypothetical protein DFQ27_007267 [Actinomortierella ambigua]
MTSGGGHVSVAVGSSIRADRAALVSSTVPVGDDVDDVLMFGEEESVNVAVDGDVDATTFAVHLAATTKTTKDHMHAENTTRNYAIYLNGGRRYCASIGKPGALDKITMDTPLVLKAYIASKCEKIVQEEKEVDQEAEREVELLEQDGNNEAGKTKSKNRSKSEKDDKPKSLSTAEAIRAAWKLYYRQTFKVQDGWRVEENGKCIGNPVDDIDLSQYIQTLRKQHKRERVIRHSIAINLQSMERLMAYLDRPDVREDHGLAKCLFFQAYAATGFYLWTRNDELPRLQGHMIEGLGVGDDEMVFKTLKTGSHYFKIKLAFRKTNQGDATKCNVYQVHPQPDSPLTCCYTRLLNWLVYLRKIGHPLRSEDYVFPTLGARGDVRLHQKVSPDSIQRYLDVFTKEAGLIKDTARARYTTHCFRRGGAQHCFMFKSPRWSLKACKWWGSWSKGAERRAIVNYLMNETSAYEESFEDQYSEDRAAYKHTTSMGEEYNDEAPSELSRLRGEVNSLRVDLQQLQAQVLAQTEILQRIAQGIPQQQQPQGIPLQQHQSFTMQHHQEQPAQCSIGYSSSIDQQQE